MALIRPYNEETDVQAIKDIWTEIGWLEASDDTDGVRWTFADGQGLVAEINGRPEVAVNGVSGSIQHMNTSVPLWGITSVTTSRVARRQNLASRMTAHSVSLGRDAGALVSILGVFDTGFYDRVGFGSGSYELNSTVDPASLRVAAPQREAKRLTVNDYAAIHAAIQNRMLAHGQARLEYPGELRAGLKWESYGAATGFETDGELTHCFYGKAANDKDQLVVHDMVYRDRSQLMELLGLLAGYADQYTSIRFIMDPTVIQLNDLLYRPVRHRRVTSTAEVPLRTDALPWWQLRLNNVCEAMSILHATDQIEFAMEVQDPIEDHLPENIGWRGESGTYRVKLGPSTVCERADGGSLPILRCSVNALSRWWFGIASANALAATSDFNGSPDLLDSLDRVLNLPQPHVNLPF